MVGESQKLAEGKHHLEFLRPSAGADTDVSGEIRLQEDFILQCFVFVIVLFWELSAPKTELSDLNHSHITHVTVEPSSDCAARVPGAPR